ncbi:MAG: hypothetical protein EOP05_04675 [Proteobacteria bacterium]|nr:MAG: hypothetical protein EOP05_04675 [Pseudomonadota bacterium]
MEVCSRLKSAIAALAVTILFVCFSGSAQAQPMDLNFPTSAYRLKSADEILALTPEKQVEYLESLQELLVELEDMYPEGWNKPRPMEEISAFKLMISNLIETATAATPKAVSLSRVAPIVRRARGGTSITCSLGLTPTKINHTQYACRKPGYSSKPCAPGFIAVNQQRDGNFGCITNASFNQLTPQNKASMRSPNRYALGKPQYAGAQKAFNVIRTKYDYNPRAVTNVAKNAKSNAVSKSKPNLASPKKVARLGKDTGANPKRTTASVNAASNAVPVEPPVSPAIDAETPEQIAEQPENESVLEGEAARFRGIARNQLDTTVLEDEGRDAILQECIIPKENECTDGRIEEAKQKLFSMNGTKDDGHLQYCMYAGNFSYWKNGRIAQGNCQRPFEFCYGESSCRNKEGERIKKVSNIACKPSEVLCNPYIFSISSKGTGYCVAPTATATRQCALLSSKDGASPNDPIVDRLKNHFLYRYENTFEGTDRQGWKRGFDSFAGKLNSLCFDAEKSETARTIAQAYCIECNLIRRRLLAMNAAAITEKCEGFRQLSIEKIREQKIMVAPTSAAPAAQSAPAASK